MTSNPPTDGIHLATEFLDRSTPASRVRNLLLRYPALSPAIVLLIAVVVFGLLNERFLLPNNLSLIVQQVAIVGTVAAAQTIIILTAGIDLSVGAAMVLASMAVRIGDLGLTPNRTAALGLNLVLLVNLAVTAWLSVGFITGRSTFHRIERWQTSYLPVFAAWAAIVVVVLPPLFGFE